MRAAIQIQTIFIRQPAKVETNIKFKVIRISEKLCISICARLWVMMKKSNFVELVRVMGGKWKGVRVRAMLGNKIIQ